MADDDVLKKVSSWAFQDAEDPQFNVGVAQTEFSLVDDQLRCIFEATRERVEKESRQPSLENLPNDGEKDDVLGEALTLTWREEYMRTVRENDGRRNEQE